MQRYVREDLNRPDPTLVSSERSEITTLFSTNNDCKRPTKTAIEKNRIRDVHLATLQT